MKSIKGDLFQVKADAICITTNGFIKNNGECVMGKGCAKQLVGYWHDAPRVLGDLIKDNGNVCQLLSGGYPYDVVAFPVKHATVINNGINVVRHMKSKFKLGDTVPGWASVADIELIVKSAQELVLLADYYGWDKVVIPRPGCGAGELDWKVVEPLLQHTLDDRFYEITYK